MTVSKSISALAMLAALAGCGGGSSGGPTVPFDGMAPSNRADVMQAADGLQSRINDNSTTVATTTLPTGTATFSGYMGVGGLGDNADLTAIGALDVSADFANNSLSAKASDFGLYKDADGSLDTDLNGTLSGTGTISGSTMSASLTGTLADDQDHTVSADLSGSFYDDTNGLTAAGSVAATIDGNSQSGEFYAIKQ